MMAPNQQKGCVMARAEQCSAVGKFMKETGCKVPCKGEGKFNFQME